MLTNLERLYESPEQNADRVTLTQQFNESSGSEQTQKPKINDSTVAASLQQVRTTVALKQFH